MPALVELAIIRQMNFRHDAEQVAAMNRKRAIIKPPFVAQRRADKYQRQKIGRRGDEAFDRAWRSPRAMYPAEARSSIA